MKSTHLLFLAPLCLASSLSAQIVSLTASDAGWYDSTGYHDPANTNYATGQGFDLTRSFFVFDLPSLDGAVTGATLRVYNPSFGYDSPDASETLSLFAVDTDLSPLTAGTGGLAAFDDLGDGPSLGSAAVSALDDDGWVSVTLAPAFLDLLQGSPARIALGAALTSLDPMNVSWDEQVFGFSDAALSAPRLDLQVSAVPEPSTYTLGGALFLAGAALLRRRRRGVDLVRRET